MPEKRYYVYLLTSSSRRALYTGVANNIYKRFDQHRNSHDSSFVGHYKAFRLVYLEVFRDVRAAIAREKEIKGWKRNKKEALIRSVNPSWKDLSAEWSNRFRRDDKHKIVPPRNASRQDDISK